jgi:predicted metal-dependent peptidase
MKLPKSVLVGPHTVQIEPLSAQVALSNGIHGDFNSVLMRIRVDTSLPESMVLDTLLHEIAHAIYAIYHLEDTDSEERVVSIYGTAMLQVFKDNKKLLELFNYV